MVFFLFLFLFVICVPNFQRLWAIVFIFFYSSFSSSSFSSVAVFFFFLILFYFILRLTYFSRLHFVFCFGFVKEIINFPARKNSFPISCLSICSLGNHSDNASGLMWCIRSTLSIFFLVALYSLSSFLLYSVLLCLQLLPKLDLEELAKNHTDAHTRTKNMQ